MGLVWMTLLGCQQDLLLLGNLTGLRDANQTVSPLRQAEVAAAASGGRTEAASVEAASVEAAPVEGGAPPAPRVEKYNPISIPEGPRENDGVRWQGVKEKAPTVNVRSYPRL